MEQVQESAKPEKDIPEGVCLPLVSSLGLQPPASLGPWPLEPPLQQRPGEQ